MKKDITFKKSDGSKLHNFNHSGFIKRGERVASDGVMYQIYDVERTRYDIIATCEPLYKIEKTKRYLSPDELHHSYYEPDPSGYKMLTDIKNHLEGRV